mmetsp:Transcript_11356/g.47501  ORF Transcript_11356/g.47501 Transcript_11356/m.47501 type:complete len:506 (-) Transcript_11356:330-1847(-)
MPSVMNLILGSSPTFLSYRTWYPTSPPRGTSSSCATLVAVDVTATRRGCVTATAPGCAAHVGSPYPDSYKNCGTCVVLPHPVSPQMTTTGLWFTWSTMSCSEPSMGKPSLAARIDFSRLTSTGCVAPTNTPGNLAAAATRAASFAAASCAAAAAVRVPGPRRSNVVVLVVARVDEEGERGGPRRDHLQVIVPDGLVPGGVGYVAEEESRVDGVGVGGEGPRGVERGRAVLVPRRGVVVRAAAHVREHGNRELRLVVFFFLFFFFVFVVVVARRDPGARNARAEPALARRRVLSAEGIDEIVPDEPNGRPIDPRQRRAVNPARVPVPRCRRGRAAEVLPVVAVARRVHDFNVGGSNPGRVLLPPTQPRCRLRAPRAAPRHRELEIVAALLGWVGRDEGYAGLAGTYVGDGSHRRHRASRHGDRLVDGIGTRVRRVVVPPPFPVVGEDDEIVIVPVARQPEPRRRPAGFPVRRVHVVEDGVLDRSGLVDHRARRGVRTDPVLLPRGR